MNAKNEKMVTEKRGRPRKDIGAAIATGAGGKLTPTSNTLSSLLNSDSIKKRFSEMLGGKAAAFGSSILSAVAANPQLKLCDPLSVISAAAIAASLDLPINQSIGFSYLVPYSGKAQFQLGWRGFVQLAMRTAMYQTMNVAEVYDGEVQRENRITGEIEFDETKRKSDKIIGYVAYFRLINGFEKYLFMTAVKIEAHGRRYSKSYDSGQWKSNFEAMAKKTVLKMLLSKWGILSTQIERALQADQAVIDGDGKENYSDAGEAEQSVPAQKPNDEKPLTGLEKKLLAENTYEEEADKIGQEAFGLTDENDRR